jgi:hypothetical protein
MEKILMANKSKFNLLEVKITEIEVIEEIGVVTEATEEVAEMTTDPLEIDQKDASTVEKKVTLLEIAKSVRIYII